MGEGVVDSKLHDSVQIIVQITVNSVQNNKIITFKLNIIFKYKFQPFRFSRRGGSNSSNFLLATPLTRPELNSLRIRDVSFSLVWLHVKLPSDLGLSGLNTVTLLFIP